MAPFEFYGGPFWFYFFDVEPFCAFGVNRFWSTVEECAMSKRKSPRQDLDAKAIEAVLEAQSLPPGPERTEALRKAEKLRNAADIYNYLFSTELRPPE